MPDLRRKTAQDERVAHSPMTQIPLEILSNIFSFYLQMARPSSIAQRRSFLIQVCKLWKTIVESDPRLWASIYFDGYKLHTDYAQRMQAIFDLHFKHSGAVPLSLTFTTSYALERNKDLVPVLAGQIQRHSHRWKHISIDMPCDDISRLFTGFTPCNLSSLEHLHIHSDGNPSQIHHLCLDSATNIKSFTSSGSSSSYINTIDLHWERLEEASFDFVYTGFMMNQNLTRLGRCQNLITCSLGIGFTLHRKLWSTTIFPRLQTLRIRRLKTNHLDTDILGFLVLPQLETLEVDSRCLVGSYGSYAPWEDRIFSNLLARSGCALRHLSIQEVDFSNEELIRCLALSPTLTSLCFMPYPRSQDIKYVIRKLVASPTTSVAGNQPPVQDGTDPQLPELREITLAISREGCLDPIVDMLRSRGKARTRAAGVAVLRRVEVIFYRRGRDPIYPHQPRKARAKLKKVESFKRKVVQWVSEVKIENANDDGSVVGKVEIEITSQGWG